MTSIIKDVEILRKKSEPVSSVQEAKEIVQKLEAVLMEHDGLGLSAIQIGIPKQVAILKKRGMISTIINPEVIERDGKCNFVGEGCLSFPGVFVKSERFEHFVIKNQIIDGDTFREETQYYYNDKTHDNKQDSDYEALACQHEIDHMDGKIIIDQWEQSSGTIIKKDKCGRNDPCPCGSLKKFKKCCIDKGIYD